MRKILIVIIGILTCSWGYAQSRVRVNLTIPPVAIINIISTGNSELALLNPTEAGDMVNNAKVDNTKWLNFTSVVNRNTSRVIQANISAGTLPTGVELKLGVSGSIGGTGLLGVPTATESSPISLTHSPQTIIGSIGGAATGIGVTGYRLNYSLGITDYSLLTQYNGTLEITFTIRDN